MSKYWDVGILGIPILRHKQDMSNYGTSELRESHFYDKRKKCRTIGLSEYWESQYSDINQICRTMGRRSNGNPIFTTKERDVELKGCWNIGNPTCLTKSEMQNYWDVGILGITSIYCCFCFCSVVARSSSIFFLFLVFQGNSCNYLWKS